MQASTFAAQLYDVVYLYGLGLHEALQDGFSPANGSLVAKYMKNTTFEGEKHFRTMHMLICTYMQLHIYL